MWIVMRLQIKMLGQFSLSFGGNRISSGDSRSKKVWMLLAYLICHRHRTVSQSEMIAMLWDGDSGSDKPENALKVTLHRVRTILDRLWPGAGHDLILRRSDGYAWNREYPQQVDAELFERLCGGSAEDRAAALELYRGEYLSGLSAGTWIIPAAAHYHNLYLQSLQQTLPLLEGQGQHSRILELCRTALPLEPYEEALHRHLMRALIALDDRKGAVEVYEKLRARLYHDFGVTPGEQTRALWREAANLVSDTTIPVEMVLDHLLERDCAAGALACEFDCFQVICRAEARSMLRSGNATHVALLAVTGERGKTLSRRSLDKAMDNLGEQIRLNLRRGDVFSKCSLSQYVIMLPQANFENSCVVCRRLIAAFSRRYPHAPVRIHYMVRPLTMVQQPADV